MSDDVLWEDGESVFRPSYSATWLGCLGSLRPSRFAQDTAGIDAAIGTVFHKVMARWQLVERPDDWLNETFHIEDFDVVVDEDMFVFGQECLDRFADVEGDRFVETRVDISAVTPIPNQGGTADLAICRPGFLCIIDWKYGIGVQVFAKHNTQLLLYALGFFNAFDPIYHFQTIELWIAQPRLNHFDLWTITRDELLEFAVWAKERAYASWKPGADRTPSPKSCQWCKVRTDCAALEAARQSLADLSFEVIEDQPGLVMEPVTEGHMAVIVAMNSPPREIPEAVTLPTAQLARILSYRKLMEAWFSDIQEELTTRALHGESMEGMWKLAEGRSRRKYYDEDRAAATYRRLGFEDEEIFVKKLASANQMKTKLSAVGIKGRLQAAFLKTLVYFPPGKPTLVPDGDNRLALPNIIDETFEADEAEL